jgi:hypothetical protein
MSTYERAAVVIADTLPVCRGLPLPEAATRILDALMAKRYVVIAMRASPDLFTRFHAHARFVGERTGDGYQGVYNDAIQYAVERDLWPCKLVVKTIDVAGEEISVDFQIPESTTKATNAQLLCAYEYVTSVAAEQRLSLPEATEAT